MGHQSILNAMTDQYAEALRRFHELLDRARQSPLREPMAMTLATADAQGRPSARTVLLKQADARGFVFYGNLDSRKGQQLAANPRAALCLFWQPLMEQVLVEGAVEPVADGEADAYWATRDRESQIGAWASLQSRPLDSRRTLEARLAQYAQQYAGRAVPRPPRWSGFRVTPDRIEFWSSRPHRLHERVLYQKEGADWRVTLLYP